MGPDSRKIIGSGGCNAGCTKEAAFSAMIKSANIVSDFADSVLAETKTYLANEDSNMRAGKNVQLAFAEATVQLAALQCRS